MFFSRYAFEPRQRQPPADLLALRHAVERRHAETRPSTPDHRRSVAGLEQQVVDDRALIGGWFGGGRVDQPQPAARRRLYVDVREQLGLAIDAATEQAALARRDAALLDSQRASLASTVSTDQTRRIGLDVDAQRVTQGPARPCSIVPPRYAARGCKQPTETAKTILAGERNR